MLEFSEMSVTRKFLPLTSFAHDHIANVLRTKIPLCHMHVSLVSLHALSRNPTRQWPSIACPTSVLQHFLLRRPQQATNIAGTATQQEMPRQGRHNEIQSNCTIPYHASAPRHCNKSIKTCGILPFTARCQANLPIPHQHGISRKYVAWDACGKYSTGSPSDRNQIVGRTHREQHFANCPLYGFLCSNKVGTYVGTIFNQPTSRSVEKPAY